MVHVILEKIRITGYTGAMPILALSSSYDITHCLTYVSEIDEQLSLGSSFVMPDFEFRVDNLENVTYFPNYPDCRNFEEYYTRYIVGDSDSGERIRAQRIHVDVRMITATTNKSLFYGALNSLTPANDYGACELTFVATQIMAKALTDMTMENIIRKEAPDSVLEDLENTTYLVPVYDILPKSWGYKQTATKKNIDIISRAATASGLRATMIRIPVKNALEWRSALDYLGDFLRATSCYYVWEDNKFSIYDIKSIWAANAAVAIDEYVTEITKSQAWDEAADDVVIEAGDNKYSGYDTREYSYYQQRPFTSGSTVTFRRAGEMIRGQANRGNNKIIDAPMLNYFYAPNQYAPSDGRRPFPMYNTGYSLAINFMAEKMWLNNRDFWAGHKIQLDCEVAGLDWYYGLAYTIGGKNYKCISTSKNLENELTKLKLVAV